MRRDQQNKATDGERKASKSTDAIPDETAKGVTFNAVSQIDDEPTSDGENDSEAEEPLSCSFSWTKMSQRVYSNDKSVYLTPWDIGNNYQLRCEQRKRSILKKTTTPKSKPVQIKAPAKPAPLLPKDVSVGAVVERGSGGASGEIILPPQKARPPVIASTSTKKHVSLFKQKRLSQK